MITSANNTQVKNIIQLNQKAKARREQGLFVAEGRKMFGEAPKDWISRVYVTESLTADEFLMKQVMELPEENAGTIFRTGEGAGVSGVFLTKTCVDITNPKVIRSTMGSVYRMPFLYVEDVVSLKAELEQKGIRTFAAHLKGKNSYDQEDYQGGTAFLIGNEGNGLTEEAAEAADCLIRIPMCGKVESLNAAMAAGILMYEAARQRR